MKKNLFIITIGICLWAISFTSSGQDNSDPVLMSIGGEKVTRSEFLTIYQKNNLKGDPIDKKSLEEYVDLFINFKLKVHEAQELGLDTLTSFKTELSGYRKQLAQNYLIDNEVNEELLKQAYERMQYDVRASHILAKCDPGASPKDTLLAYNKITELRNRVLKGESFSALAKQASDDPSARDREASGNRPAQKGNGGDLGYFTVFDMVYPFENAAFNTRTGEVSMPIRTDYGYHLLKVTDKKKAMGKVKVAHIYIGLNQNSTKEDSLKARTKIFEAYQAIQNGSPYDSVCKQYSEDKGTASKGGALPWFGVNRMVPEFIVAVSALEKPGDMTAPFITPFGWHIAKLLEKKDIGTFEEVKSDIKQKVSKDTRSQLTKDAVIKKIKEQYTFREFPQAKDQFIPVLDSTIFQAGWDAGKASGLNKPLFTIGDKTYSQTDFAKYLAREQKARTPEDISVFLTANYKKFVDESCMDYKDSKLEGEFPEFRNLMKEYHDGILLFDLTDQKVWTKAIKDSTGLEDFYKQNSRNYLWGQRLDASTFKSMDKEKIYKAYKLVKKNFDKGFDETAILKKVNRKDTLLPVRAERAKYSKGENKVMDGIKWEKGVTEPVFTEPMWMFVTVHNVLEPEPKRLNEARGLVTADYQNYLEKAWIQTLRSKYSIEVNRDVLSTIK